MRLLHEDGAGGYSLVSFLDDLPPYAILSHTWGADEDEVTFEDLQNGSGVSKAGYEKIRLCGQQAVKDGLKYFWVDTCCIKKSSDSELTEALNSMFQWYRNSTKCYAYLQDWEGELRRCRWFTRGWTLQELLAPASVDFFSKDWQLVGTKGSLEQQLSEITTIPIEALRGTRALSYFSCDERMSWTKSRMTTRKEDKVYSLLGIFDIYMPVIYGEGESHAFARLQREMQSKAQFGGTITSIIVPSPSLSQNTHWMVPRNTNTLFTGRTEVLSTIRSALCTSTDIQQQRRFVITGSGGQGKSEICLKILDMVRDRFWGVFWVDASSETTAIASFARVSTLLGSQTDDLDTALHLLANATHDWLIVLDNADDPNTDYSRYFPTGSRGALLLTSRNPECDRYHTVGIERLGSLDNDAGVELLLKAANIPDSIRSQRKPAAKRVVAALGSHTLALIQAGAYISKGYCSIEQYPETYRQQRRRLMMFSLNSNQSRYRSSYATFEASALVLDAATDETSQDALELLHLLAIFHNENVPLCLFHDAFRGVRYWRTSRPERDPVLRLTQWHMSQVPSFVQANLESWDSFRLQAACNLLQSLALVTVGNEGGSVTISMHPLIHDWTSVRQQQVQKCRSIQRAGCVFAFSSFLRAVGQIPRPSDLQSRSHLAIFHQQLFESPRCVHDLGNMLPVIAWCMSWLEDLGMHTSLASALDGLFQQLQADPSEPNEELLEFYRIAGLNLLKTGKYEESVALRLKIDSILGQRLPENHPDRLGSQYELAASYSWNVQTMEAIQLLEHVVEIWSTLAEDNPSRLASQHELAAAYLENGQVREAVQLLEHVVRINRTLAEDNPSRLSSQHELARAYLKNDQVKEAVQLLEHVVGIQSTLAEDNPSRLSSEHELTKAYLENGQVSEAIQLLEHVVLVQQSLAETHLGRLASQHWLAIAYRKDNRVTDCVRLLEHVVRMQHRTVRQDHKRLLVSQYQLGISYHDNGQINEAIKMLEHVAGVMEGLPESHPVRQWQRNLPEDHFNRMRPRELLRTYRDKGQDVSDNE